MSYIAFELDAYNQVPLVASVAGMKPAEVTHGLLTMWIYVFRSSCDIVNDTHIEAFFGTKKIAQVLATFGFLEAGAEGWRVKGGDRYKRLRATRSEAGKRGRAAQLKAARANAGQTPGKTGQTPKNDTFARANAGQTPGKTGQEPGQTRAVARAKPGPYTEGVPLKGNTPSDEGSVEKAPASLPAGAGSGAHAAPTNGKRPRPVLVPGTPEYADAVARDDWNALGWKPA